MAAPGTKIFRRLGYVGAALELTPGTRQAPTSFFKVEQGLIQSDQTVTPYRDANTRDATFALKEKLAGKGSFQTFLYADEGAALLAWAIGADGAVGTGRTGTLVGAAPTAVLKTGYAAGVTSIVITWTAGDVPATGQNWQIDVNGVGPVTTAEIVTFGTVGAPAGADYTCPITTPIAGLAYAHLISAPVKHVGPPYTHPIQPADALPYVTFECGSATPASSLMIDQLGQEMQVRAEGAAPRGAVRRQAGDDA